MIKNLFLVITLFSFTLFGQNITPPVASGESWVKMMQNPNANFYDIQAAFNSYWEGKTIQKGKGYKVFKRWENEMKPRVYPSGNTSLISQTFQNFIEWEAQNPQSVNKSTSGDWSIVGPVGAPSNGGAGRLNFIRFLPGNTNTIFVGAPDGGLWKTTNGGTSWTTSTDQLSVIGCTDIAIDPTNTQTMYLATGDGDANDSYSVGVLKSTDGGTTWNTTGLNWTVDQVRTISKLLMHPTNSSILIAATSNGIYRTTNAGTSWTQVKTGSFMDMEFKPGDPNIMYASGDSFYKSSDNGATWSQITSGIPSASNVQRIAIGVSEANSNYVYLLVGSYSDQGLYGVYRSTNSGTSFTERHSSSPNLLGWESNGSDSGGQAFYDLTIAVSPLNAEQVLVGGVNIWRSTDGGANFTINAHWWGDVAPYVHADHHDIVFLPGSSTYFSANDGGIFKTTNNGTSWTDLSSNIAIAQQYRISLSTSNSNLIVSGHQDNGSNKYNGTSWAQIKGGDGMDCFIDRTNNNTIIASYVYGEHAKSTDGGVNFTDIVSGLPTGGSFAEWLSVIHQDPTTANTYYAGGRTALYKSTNAGTSWSSLGTPTGTGKILEFTIAPSNNQIIYAIKQNAISKSTNGGTSFTNITGTLPVSSAALTNVSVSNTDPNIIFVTFSGYSSANKVFKSTDGGTSWTNYTTGLPNVPCNTIVYHNSSSDQSVYVGTDVGVFYRNNNLTSWTMYSNGLPRVSVRDLEIYYASNLLRAATYGRGTWESDLYSASVPPVADFSASQTNLTVGQSTTFTDLSTGTPTSYSWSFPGGTPSTSTSANPTITYNTIGTYDVTLTVGNAEGSDGETKTGYIVVSAVAAPTADFTVSNTDLCPGQSVTFTSTSTGSPTSYSWSFPGGTPSSSTDQNPVVTYSSNGTYNVTLTVTNAGGSDSETKTNYITVNQGSGLSLPFTEGFITSNFLTDYTIIDAGGSANWSHTTTYGTAPTDGNSMIFNNYSTDETGFNDEIHFPALDLTTAINPTLTFDVAYANYDATHNDGLEVLVSTDCGNTFTYVYNKTGATLATAAATTDPFYPTAAQWRNESVDLSSFSSSSGLIIAFKNIAGYGNILYVDNVNVSGLTVPAPIADFTSTNTTICQGSSVTFTDNSQNSPTSYSWQFPGGTPSTSTSANPTVIYNTAGVYDVTLTVSNDGGSDTKTMTSYITVLSSSSQSLPFSEGFTSTSFLPNSDWSSVNEGDVNAFWSRIDTVGKAPTDGNSMFYDNLNNNEVGNNDEVWLPKLNLTTMSNPSLTFDVAYAQYNSSYFDGLEVLISTDCGQTFTSLYNKSGSTLATAPDKTTAFVPTADQWRNESIDLTSYQSNNSVILAFRNIAGYGNLLYIDNISITGQSSPPNASFTSDQTTICKGNSISFSSTSSGSPTSYSWTFQGGTPSTSTVQNPDVLYNTAGVYNVSLTVTNANGSDTETLNGYITVNEATTPTISANGSLTFCEGGSVTLTSSASTGNTWSNGSTSQSINVTTSGTYNVSITQNGCTATSSNTNVTVNSNPTITLGNTTNPTTCGSATGTITISGSGTGNLSWSGTSSGSSNNVSLPQTISSLVAGSYTISFTNSNSCTSNIINATLTDPGAPTTPTITASGSLTFCEGGSVTLTSSASTGNTWSNGATTQSITVNTSGIYSVTVSQNGCTATSSNTSVTVNSNPIITLGTTTNPTTCGTATGTISISGSGTGNLSWSGTSSGSLNNVTLPQTINNLTSGTYSISFTNVNSCTSNILNATLTDPGAPTTPTITSSGDLTFCEGGSVTLTSSASSGNLWSNGATTQSIMVTSSGTYNVSISQNGCTATSSNTSVTVNSNPVISLGTTTNPTTCGTATGTITISGNGSGNLNWSGSSNGSLNNITLPQLVGNLTAGSYSFIFTNANSCNSNTITATLTDPNAPDEPTITASGDLTFCDGGNVTLTSSATTGNLWSNGATSQSITVSTSGSYSVSISQNGCISSSTVSIVNVLQNPIISLGSVSNPSTCGTATGSIVISGADNGNLTWTGSSSGSINNVTLPQTISNLSAGSYSITFTNSNSCSSNTLTASLSDPGAPAIPTITASGALTFCEGGSVTLTSSASSGNTWSTGATTQAITVNNNGTYYVSQSLNGCTSTSNSVSVVVNTNPIISLGTTVNPTSCNTNTGSITVNGSNSIGNLAWTGEANGNINGVTLPQVISNLGNGSYSISFESNEGCSSNILSVSLVDPANPTPTITANGPITFCEGGNVILTSSNANQYLWSNGANTQSITVTTSGTYNVTVTVNGCSGTSTSTNVNVNSLPTVSINNISEMCNNDAIYNLTEGTPSGGVYSGLGVINNNQFNPSIANIGNNTITYTYTDNNGCTNSSSTIIVVDDCSSLNDLSNSNIKIFPNPSKENINITGIQISKIEMYNASGKLIYFEDSVNDSYTIDVKSISSGIYIIKVISKDKTSVHKIEVKH